MRVSALNREICKSLSLVVLSFAFQFFLWSESSAMQDCYSAKDGAPYVRVKAYPNEMFKAGNKRVSQVAKWIKTDIFVRKGTKFAIKGKVYPWGHYGGEGKPCKMIGCDAFLNKYQSFSAYAGVCFSEAERKEYEMNEGMVLEPNGSNVGCYMKHGAGLYGMIVSGSGDDINLSADTSYDPFMVSDVATFHFNSMIEGKGGEFVVGEDNDDEEGSYLYELTHAYKFSYEDGGKYIKTENPSGRLYIKFMDSYYADNYGDYTVTFYNASVDGFIRKTFAIFEKELGTTTDSLLSAVAYNFRSLAEITIYLYLVFTFISFLLGTVAMTQGEMFTRLFKVAIVLSMLSNRGFGMLEGWLRDLMEYLPKVIASSIARAGGSSLHFGMDSGGSISGLSGAIAEYQSLFDVCIALSTHVKIISLLFTSKIYFIILIYILIVMYIQFIFKMLLLGILCIFRVSLLMITYPIFLVLVLFKITADTFNSWLNQLMSVSILSIMVTTIMIISKLFLEEGLLSLLEYQVCKRSFLGIPYYYPTDKTQLAQALSLSTYLYTMLKSIVIIQIAGQLPKMADGFSSTFIGGLSSMYSYGMRAAGEVRGMAGSGIDSVLSATKLDRVGKAVSRSKLNPLYLAAKPINKINRGVDAVKRGYESTLGSFLKPKGSDPFGLNEYKRKIALENEERKTVDNLASRGADSELAKKYGTAKTYAGATELENFAREFDGDQDKLGVVNSLRDDNKRYKILSEMDNAVKEFNISHSEALNIMERKLPEGREENVRRFIADVKAELKDGKLPEKDLEKKLSSVRERIMDKNNKLNYWAKRNKD